MTLPDKWIIQISYDSKEVFIDRVRIVDGVPYHWLEAYNELGDPIGIGRILYDTKEDAIIEAKSRISKFFQEMLEKCK